jgi:hypothetical protein
VETTRRRPRHRRSRPPPPAFTDEDIGDFDTHYKMNPPLRTKADNEALLEGLLDGTFDLIATDHAPHTPFEKSQDFVSAPTASPASIPRWSRSTTTSSPPENSAGTCGQTLLRRTPPLHGTARRFHRRRPTGGSCPLRSRKETTFTKDFMKSKSQTPRSSTKPQGQRGPVSVLRGRRSVVSFAALPDVSAGMRVFTHKS